MSFADLLRDWRTWIAYTGKELTRKRVIVVTLILSLCYLALFAVAFLQLAAHLGHTDDPLNRSIFALGNVLLGLYSAQLVVAFFVLFSTMGTISGEIDSGLLLTVLSRPIPRWRIFAGKWAGFAVWSLLYTAVLFWGIVAVVGLKLHLPVDAAALWRAFGLYELIPLLLVSLSLLASSYLPMLGTGILTALVYGLGWFGGLLERFYNLPGIPPHAGIEKFGLVTSLIMPADAIYRRATYELIGLQDLPLAGQISRSLGPFGVSDVPSGAFIVYTVIYMGALLVWGAVHFSRRDV
jgi:ABC-type transport system involved in multi-copper enzyme maturation permease subunit